MKNKNVHKKLVYFCEATFFLRISLHTKSRFVCTPQSIHWYWDPCQYYIVSLSLILSIHLSIQYHYVDMCAVCTAIQFVAFIRWNSSQWALSTVFKFYFYGMKFIPRPKTHTADVFSHFEWFAWCICTLLFVKYQSKKNTEWKMCCMQQWQPKHALCTITQRDSLWISFGEKNAPAQRKNMHAIRNETG